MLNSGKRLIVSKLKLVFKRVPLNSDKDCGFITGCAILNFTFLERVHNSLGRYEIR